jgi:hypothetical protein
MVDRFPQPLDVDGSVDLNMSDHWFPWFPCRIFDAFISRLHSRICVSDNYKSNKQIHTHVMEDSKIHPTTCILLQFIVLWRAQ